MGWLAKNAESPRLSKFLIDAREFINPLGWAGLGQDTHNHELGFGIEADTWEEATRAIRRLIEDGEAKVYTPEEIRFRGSLPYQAGGAVGTQQGGGMFLQPPGGGGIQAFNAADYFMPAGQLL